MSTHTAHLRLEASSSSLAFHAGETITLPVSVRHLADAVLRQDPPAPFELQRAIDEIEDALGRSKVTHGDRGTLVTTDTVLAALPGLTAAGSGLTRDQVEVLFQRLASRSLGTPVIEAELPLGRDFAAALLILRECMHHLGFWRVAFSTECRAGSDEGTVRATP